MSSRERKADSVRAKGERGAGTILVAVICCIVVASLVVVAHILGWYQAAHRLRDSTDLAALTAASHYQRNEDATAACRLVSDTLGQAQASPTRCEVVGDSWSFSIKVEARRQLDTGWGIQLPLTARARAGLPAWGQDQSKERR